MRAPQANETLSKARSGRESRSNRVPVHDRSQSFRWPRPSTYEKETPAGHHHEEAGGLRPGAANLHQSDSPRQWRPSKEPLRERCRIARTPAPPDPPAASNIGTIEPRFESAGNRPGRRDSARLKDRHHSPSTRLPLQRLACRNMGRRQIASGTVHGLGRQWQGNLSLPNRRSRMTRNRRPGRIVGFATTRWVGVTQIATAKWAGSKTKVHRLRAIGTLDRVETDYTPTAAGTRHAVNVDGLATEHAGVHGSDPAWSLFICPPCGFLFQRKSRGCPCFRIAMTSSRFSLMKVTSRVNMTLRTRFLQETCPQSHIPT